MGCHSLLQGIFLTQGSNPGLPHCRQALYHLSQQGSPVVCHYISIKLEKKKAGSKFRWDGVSWACRGSPLGHLLDSLVLSWGTLPRTSPARCPARMQGPIQNHNRSAPPVVTAWSGQWRQVLCPTPLPRLSHLPDGFVSVGKEAACSARAAGDSGSIPGLGRSPRGGNGNPLQYSCLGNPMDSGAWRKTWGL